MSKTKYSVPKSFLVKILQWFYLLLGVLVGSSLLWYQRLPYMAEINIPETLVYLIVGFLVFYCLLLTLSFLTQNTNLLIFSLVLIFFTSIGAILMTIPGIFNFQNILSGNLPECSKSIVTCNTQDGIVVAAAFLLAVAVPTLIINFITIVGAVKGIAATD